MRSPKGLRTAKMADEFEAFVKVAPEKPAKADASFTPGVLLMTSIARLVTSSVRDSDDPSGVCTTAIRYP
jgi:hypothetical protein